MIIEDNKKFKFGGFCAEEWNQAGRFCGTGDNYVFTFKNTDNCELWDATGENSMFQFCDRSGFGLGGGIHGGRFSLYLGDDLWRGSSVNTECFNNE
jgi:hypothetical protein